MRKNLEKAHELLMERIPGDISYTLRGLSQVIIVNNQVSGLFVVAALYVGGGALLGTLSLVCTFVATAWPVACSWTWTA
jgi:urea transporter